MAPKGMLTEVEAYVKLELYLNISKQLQGNDLRTDGRTMRDCRCLFLIFTCLLGGIASAEPPAELQVETFEGLEVGDSVSRERPVHGIHEYRWDFPGPRYLRGMVHQGGVDLRLRWVGPGGEVLRVIDGGGTEVEENFALQAEGTGEHRLEIAPIDINGDDGGPYTLQLFELREPQPGDAVRVEAWERFQRGRRAYVQLARSEARAIFQETLGSFEVVGDPMGEAMALQQLGWLAADTETYQLARDLYRKALDRLEPSPAGTLWYDLLADLGSAEAKLGNFSESLAKYREALAAFEAAGVDQSRAATLYSMGLALRSLGRHEEAREVLEHALELHRALENHRLVVRTLNSLGLVMSDLGLLTSACEKQEQALEISREMRFQEGVVRSLLHLGACHRRLGELEEALRLLTQAREVNARRGQDAATERDIVARLAQTWLDIGDFDRARDHATRALELSLATQNLRNLAEAHYYVASIHRLTGDVAAAREHYEEALQALSQRQDLALESVTLLGLARCFVVLGQLEAAEKSLEQARARTLQGRRVHLQFAVRIELGRLRRLQGDFEESRSILEATRRQAREFAMTSLEALSQGSLARLEREQGRLEAAYAEIQRALDLYESLRSRVENDQLRALFLARRLEDYRFAVDVLLELHEREPTAGYDALALTAHERTRARTLLEILRGARVDPERDLPPEFRQQRRSATARLTRVQNQLLELLASPSPDPEVVSSLRTELRDVIQEMDRLDLAASRGSPKLDSRPFDLATVQALLDPGTVLLEYALREQGSYVFLVTDASLMVRKLTKETEIDHWLDRLQAELRRPSQRTLALQQAAAELYQMLIEPFEARLVDESHLIIVPDGPLFYLPFEVLRRQPPEMGHLTDGYLLSSWSVSYAPSAMALVALAERKKPPMDRLELVAFSHAPIDESSEPIQGPVTRTLLSGRGRAFGPLPHAREEVIKIAGLFPAEAVRLKLDEEASEAWVKNSPDVRRARRLHFAVHGVINEQSPEYSGLYLAESDSGEDGLLQVREIFDLEISADIVVLSACETGLGRQIRGEGILGLSRAFFYAGTPLIVVSLWPVGDQSTAQLMIELYRYLLDGSETHEALRRAKLKLLEQNRFAHPYYWAPFVLFGRS